jgi:hypothetical protein
MKIKLCKQQHETLRAYVEVCAPDTLRVCETSILPATWHAIIWNTVLSCFIQRVDKVGLEQTHMTSPTRLHAEATEGRRTAPATLPETDFPVRGVGGRIRCVPPCARPSENAPTCIVATCASCTDRDMPVGGNPRRLLRPPLTGGGTPAACVSAGSHGPSWAPAAGEGSTAQATAVESITLSPALPPPPC